ncbi:unnamed protein product [Dibothriocephalus latus]|uniref:Uncharacterized protein n=1 Tax=Dibothriocephalus latus TaxID=60516 RepID=A0A3P7LWA5_DIBLA|nr:unnamed protein product [Dibothriocephalus latus]
MNRINDYVDNFLSDGETITVEETFRLGKAEPSRDLSLSPRLLKVFLKNDAQAALLVERRMALKNSHKIIFFQPDYDPRERMKMRELRRGMKERMNRGETGLRIKDGIIIQMKKTFWWGTPATMKAGSRQHDQQ